MIDRSSPLAREKWWLLANLFGALAYLWLASKTWIEPELRGEGVSRTGDALLWGVTALPLLFLFVIANSIWSWRRHWQRRGRWPELLVLSLWLFAFLADRHFS